MGTMWSGMLDQRRELALAALIGTAASASAVALLGTSAWLISTAAELPPVLTLTVAAVLVRFFALGRAVFRYGERIVGHDAAFRGLTSLRVKVYENLERLAPVGLSRFTRGDLMNRLISDVDSATDLPLRVVLPWLQATVVLVGTSAALSWLLPSAGIWIATMGLVAVVLTPWLSSSIAIRAERRIAPAKSELTSIIVTALHSSADLLAHNGRTGAMNRITGVDGQAADLMRRESFALGVGGGLTTIIQGAAVIGCLFLGIPAVRDGELHPVWLAVLCLVPLALFDILAGLPAAALALIRVSGSAERLAHLQEGVSPVHEPAHARIIAGPGIQLTVRDLHARWSPTKPYALAGVNFDVSSGTRLAIVGPSGSGKSTLATVLMGFLDYEGSILVNGVELRESDHQGWRSLVGLMPQEVHIFDTSVQDNIRLGRVAISQDQVWDALEVTSLAPMVRDLPDGADARLGPCGLSISGGEAQRMSLARLMVQPPELLILDEPTEHLDHGTATEISRMIDQLTAHTARILITHTVTSLREDDRVLVLRDGAVEACGYPVELRSASGWFAERWREEVLHQDMSSLIAELPIGRGVPQSHLPAAGWPHE